MKRQAFAFLLAAAAASAAILISTRPATSQGSNAPPNGPPGDITSVGPTPGGGLAGGAEKGPALLGLLTTCRIGQVLQWSGTSWACSTVGERTFSSIYEGQITSGRHDNYAPVGNSGARTWFMMGGDNEGTFITGISIGQAVGDSRIICNQGAQIDATTIVLRNESPFSTEANRFATPNRADFKIPVDQCVEVQYQTTATAACGVGCAIGGNRWMVNASGGRTMQALVQSLMLTGFITPAAITGTVHNWNPTAAGVELYPSGFCLDGNNCSFEDNTVVRIITTDLTDATITGLVWPGNTFASGNGPVKVLANYGPGDVILDHIGGSSIGNQFSLPNSADVRLRVGESAIVWHGVNDANWTVIGLNNNYSDGVFRQLQATGIANGAYSIGAGNSNTGQTAPGGVSIGVRSQMSGSYTTAAGNVDVYGVVGQVSSTESAGANTLTNFGIFGDATGGNVNYAAFFDNGIVRVAGAVVMAGQVEMVGPIFSYGHNTFGGAEYLTGVVTPAVVGGAVNDYAPDNFSICRVLRIQTSIPVTLSGLAGGANGRTLTLINTGAHSVTILAESALSREANRFTSPITLQPTGTAGHTATIWYDVVTSRWVQI